MKRLAILVVVLSIGPVSCIGEVRLQSGDTGTADSNGANADSDSTPRSDSTATSLPVDAFDATAAGDVGADVDTSLPTDAALADTLAPDALEAETSAADSMAADASDATDTADVTDTTDTADATNASDAPDVASTADTPDTTDTQSPLDAALLASWGMDGPGRSTDGALPSLLVNDLVSDSSGHAYDCIVSNTGTSGTLEVVSGKRGNALLFSGDDFLRVEKRLATAVTQLTYMAWVKRATIDNWHAILNNNAFYTEGDIHFQVRPDTNRLEFAVNGNSQPVESNFRMIDGNWHHVALTYDSTAMEVTFYVDGTVDSVTYLSTAVPCVIGPLRIGGWLDYGDNEVRQFEGLLDDVRIYTRALTAAEIRAVVAP